MIRLVSRPPQRTFKNKDSPQLYGIAPAWCFIHFERFFKKFLNLAKNDYTSVKWIDGKGGKSRIAYLSGYAADILDLYLESAREQLLERRWRKNGDKLFGADVATLLYAVNNGLKEICKKLKIPVITCNGFRHSLGTHLLRAGCDLRHIQLILGHEKLSSTQRYTRVDRRELKNVIDRYHPRQIKIREKKCV